MSLVFKPERHEYQSLGDDNIEWISVTSVVSKFKQPFDAGTMSLKSSKNKKSKWYGMSPDEIQTAWKDESNRAMELGTWYHGERERDLCNLDSIQVEGITLPIFKPIESDGMKFAPDQKLKEGIYPEHLVYLKSAGICGQADIIEVINGKLNVGDFKTNKEIKTEGFKSWEGISQKMGKPLSHLDDCHLNHYALQLSLYMYIILKHNPLLKPGKMTIHHIIFEEAGRDKYDNRIIARDSNGDPIVKEVVPYDLPYLKSEVITVINWLKDNRGSLKKKAA